jgi:type IV secretory pathway VirB10-like protein
MFSNKLALAGLATACIAAAGIGGYVASRQNTTPAPLSAAAPATTAAVPTAPLDRPVQETEAVVGDSRPAGASASDAPDAPAASPKRAPAAARSASEGRSAASKNGRTTPSKPTGPTLDRSWPSGAASAAPSTPPSLPSAEPAPQRLDDRALSQELPAAPEPPQKAFDELVVSTDSVIGLQNETTVTSEHARVEDRVEARVARDVKVGDKVAIPAGSRVIGSVMQVDHGGKFKERARLGVRFHTVVLADGTRLPISTDTIFRDGSAPANESAAKIGGGAVGGAIIGAILGGAKGAAIGGLSGAGAGTAVVAAGERNAATLRAGEPITVRLLSPVTVTTER